MTRTSIQRRYADILSRISRPARLIGNEFGAGPGFSGRMDELRVALAFPDTYEIGISNQAIQILYHLARQMDGVGVERVYLPWVDAIREMRDEEVPLLTLETWSPVASADLLGVTLQHEFNYTNVLELLDLAGIPLLAVDRTEEHPLVVGGGPAVADFLPMAPFLDAVAVGDGEVIFVEMLEVLRAAKTGGEWPGPGAPGAAKTGGQGRGAATTVTEPGGAPARGLDRRAVLKGRLAEIEGVFVPGVSSTVTRRVLPRLEGAPYPASCLVPLSAGVHDRAWVEIMRGCSRGCRFCQAGMWYRPVRERSPESIRQMVSAQLGATGHEELALASLSTTDYSCLEELLAGVAAEHPETKMSLPSLRVDSAAVRLAHLVSPTGPSLTLAPEAGSQRMRDVVNKNVTEADILGAAEEAFRCGYTTLKLYFIIGLPLEMEADVEAIADLCLRIRVIGREMLGPKANRLQLSVSINNFVPKPFTPFQWTGMMERAIIRERQELLRARLRKPGIKVALHDVDKSYLEAALARGGEEMATVILEAWRRGARFDSWTEQFRGSAWREALDLAGTSAETLATATLPLDAELPWNIIGGAAETAYLREEWQRATQALQTPDCRDGECGACGACPEGPAIDLARNTAVPAGTVVSGPAAALETSVPRGTSVRPTAASRPAPVPAADPAASAAASTAGPAGGRFLLTFAVTDRARFIGHLDKMEILRRAVRRAGGRLALSEGMRPKPRLALALPLGVGVEARAELCEFELAGAPSGGFAERLAAALPAGLELVSLEPYEAAKHAAARVVAAEYEAELEAGPGEAVPDTGLVGALQEASERFAALPELIVEEEKEGRLRQVDVRAYVERVSIVPGREGEAAAAFTIAMTPTGSVRPQRVAKTLAHLADLDLRVRKMTRTSIILA